MDSPLLKISEVASRLSVSTSFVYEIIADGRLRHHRLGFGRGRGQGAIRVSEEQLAAYLASCESAPAESQPTVTRPRPHPGVFSHLPPS
jgi:excisionase family DNA binding protein